MSEYLNQVNETVTRLYVEAKKRVAEERGQTAAEQVGIIVVAASPGRVPELVHRLDTRAGRRRVEARSRRSRSATACSPPTRRAERAAPRRSSG